mgnify:CR=1 FL=1
MDELFFIKSAALSILSVGFFMLILSSVFFNFKYSQATVFILFSIAINVYIGLVLLMSKKKANEQGIIGFFKQLLFIFSNSIYIILPGVLILLQLFVLTYLSIVYSTEYFNNMFPGKFNTLTTIINIILSGQIIRFVYTVRQYIKKMFKNQKLNALLMFNVACVNLLPLWGIFSILEQQLVDG